MASQTATEQGNAKLPIFYFKTTWSQFQKKVGPLLSEAKLSYVYSILKPHGQTFRRQVRLPMSEATPSYIYSILKSHSQKILLIQF